MTRTMRTVLALVAALSFATGAGTAAAAPSSTTPAPQPGLSAAQSELAVSATPKTVLLDAATGKVISLKTDTGFQPSIVVNNPCQAGNACWTPARTPYAAFGFAYTGTVAGSWPQRGYMATHNHSTSVCWAPNLCSARYGANSTIAFTSPVTGTRVTNYT